MATKTRKAWQPPTVTAFQLKIRLARIEPEIWRRVIVPANLTLRELHAVIQGAMGWQDYHLHMFEIGDRRFEVPESDKIGPADGCEDERRTMLGTLLRQGMTFTYLYDFGDDWEHLVTVEEAISDDGDDVLPRCIGGWRACPPEDCGGLEAYPELLEILTEPGHPEHRHMTDWAQGFKPEIFSISQANALIGLLCALYHERKWGF